MATMRDRIARGRFRERRRKNSDRVFVPVKPGVMKITPNQPAARLVNSSASVSVWAKVISRDDGSRERNGLQGQAAYQFLCLSKEIDERKDPARFTMSCKFIWAL